jgi:hypothetical protein
VLVKQTIRKRGLRAEVCVDDVHELLLPKHPEDRRWFNPRWVTGCWSELSEAAFPREAKDANTRVNQRLVAFRQEWVCHHIHPVESSQVVLRLSGQAPMAVELSLDFVGGRRPIEHGGVDDRAPNGELDC